jgi:hypothetical protein
MEEIGDSGECNVLSRVMGHFARRTWISTRRIRSEETCLSPPERHEGVVERDQVDTLYHQYKKAMTNNMCRRLFSL